MEEEIRKIVRDELCRYFAALANTEEYESETYTSQEYYENEIDNLTKECKLLREENAKLRKKLSLNTLTVNSELFKDEGFCTSDKTKGGFLF